MTGEGLLFFCSDADSVSASTSTGTLSLVCFAGYVSFHFVVV